MTRGNSKVEVLAAHCCDYRGDPRERARLLPKVLIRLGYDVGAWKNLRPGERIFARHPTDREFLVAPEILDDLQTAYEITPEPFELIGAQANNTDNPPVVWAARVRGVGDYQHGQRPAATLIAALLIYQQHRKRIEPPPILPGRYRHIAELIENRT